METVPLFRLCFARKCNFPAWIQFTFFKGFSDFAEMSTNSSLSKFPRLLPGDFHVNTCIWHRDSQWKLVIPSYFWISHLYASGRGFRLSYEARLSFRAWTWMHGSYKEFQDQLFIASSVRYNVTFLPWSIFLIGLNLLHWWAFLPIVHVKDEHDLILSNNIYFLYIRLISSVINLSILVALCLEFLFKKF